MAAPGAFLPPSRGALPSGQACAQQATVPAPPGDAPDGYRLFVSTGCAACHRIAGTAADGRIGPDLTHLASRRSIGANLLPMSAANLSEWIARTQALKPGVRMPSFGMLPAPQLAAITDYLMTLE